MGRLRSPEPKQQSQQGPREEFLSREGVPSMLEHFGGGMEHKYKFTSVSSFPASTQKTPKNKAAALQQLELEPNWPG